MFVLRFHATKHPVVSFAFLQLVLAVRDASEFVLEWFSDPQKWILRCALLSGSKQESTTNTPTKLSFCLVGITWVSIRRCQHDWAVLHQLWHPRRTTSVGSLVLDLFSNKLPMFLGIARHTDLTELVGQVRPILGTNSFCSKLWACRHLVSAGTQSYCCRKNNYNTDYWMGVQYFSSPWDCFSTSLVSNFPDAEKWAPGAWGLVQVFTSQ